MAGYAGYLSGITLGCVVARPRRWQSNAFYMNGEADLPFDCRFLGRRLGGLKGTQKQGEADLLFRGV
jgi:hypothetical protein